MTDKADSTKHTSENESNPFAVSSLFQGSLTRDQQVAPPPSWFRVDGNTLLCGPRVVLPAICVHELTDVDLGLRRVQVVYPSLKIVLVARMCDVSYFQTRAWLRWWIRSLLCGGAFVGGIALLFVAASPVNPSTARVMAISGLLMIVGSIVALSLRRPGLWLARYEPPGIYHVRGFSIEFLAALAAHPNASPDNWHAQL